jgi:hypothetical protein
VAGTLLHVTLADQVSQALIASEQAELGDHIQDYRLGAVLPDLPYYDRLIASGLRSVAGLEMHYNTWGTLLHLRAPSLMACALLNRADSGSGRALALGFLTHLAVDLVFHREIHRQVLETADGSISLDSVHKRIEDRLDLFAYRRFTGGPGIGTAYARQMLTLGPDPGWCDQVRGAIAEVHGTPPETDQLRGWLKNLARFGLWCSFRKAPREDALGNSAPTIEADSRALSDRAIRRGIDYIHTGLAFLDGRLSDKAFLKAVPNRSLVDGGRAEPARPGRSAPAD